MSEEEELETRNSEEVMSDGESGRRDSHEPSAEGESEDVPGGWVPDDYSFRSALETVERYIKNMSNAQFVGRDMSEGTEVPIRFLRFQRPDASLVVAAEPTASYFELRFPYNLVSEAERALANKRAAGDEEVEPKAVEVPTGEAEAVLTEHRNSESPPQVLQAINNYMTTQTPCDYRVSQLESGDIEFIVVVHPIYPYSDDFSIQSFDMAARRAALSGNRVVEILGNAYDFEGMATASEPPTNLRYVG